MAADNNIRWLIWDFKPDFIIDGPYKGQGYGDKLLNLFKQHLSDYEHTTVSVNTKRWAQEIDKPGTCTPLLWLGFFPNTLIYSKPYSFTAPYVIYTHKTKTKLFGMPGETLSLTKLLKNRGLRLGVLPIFMGDNFDTTRYPTLAKHLKPYVGQSHIKEFNSSANQFNLTLLKQNRVDYAIGNPLTANVIAKIKGVENEYNIFRIKEHPYYKTTGVACFNDDLGAKVIREINNVLTPETMYLFLSYMEEWNGKDPIFRTKTHKLIKGISDPDIIN